jgi:hypothetical protein
MARRSAYAAVGPFNDRDSFYADVEMWMRLNLRFPVAYVAEPLIRITPHESDHPYAYVNWSLERGLVAMREEIADGLYRDDPVAAALLPSLAPAARSALAAAGRFLHKAAAPRPVPAGTGGVPFRRQRGAQDRRPHGLAVGDGRRLLEERGVTWPTSLPWSVKPCLYT